MATSVPAKALATAPTVPSPPAATTTSARVAASAAVVAIWWPGTHRMRGRMPVPLNALAMRRVRTCGAARAPDAQFVSTATCTRGDGAHGR